MLNFYSNKGMYLEEIINRTNEYYFSKNIAFIEKRNVPIKIIKKINEKNILGYLMSKSNLDYFGCWKNNYIEFEAKETNKDYFDKSLLKLHQNERLELLNKNKIICFLIIYFSNNNSYFMVNYDWYIKQKNKIEYIKFCNECKKIEFIYPGIIDYLSVI